jgi:hypothetical protein
MSIVLAQVLAASAVLLGGPPAPACDDPLARELSAAGWHGTDNRIAWAVVHRESNNRPTTTWGGAYGLFQLQAGVWSGASWWDWDTVLTREGNIRMAYTLWSETGWRPWGISDDGLSIDTTDYGMWSSSRHYAWIWEPYKRYWNMYPCG